MIFDVPSNPHKTDLSENNEHLFLELGHLGDGFVVLVDLEGDFALDEDRVVDQGLAGVAVQLLVAQVVSASKGCGALSGLSLNRYFA